MSYNVDNVRILSGKPTLNAAAAAALTVLREKHKEDLPEDCFLDDDDVALVDGAVLNSLNWTGTWSGNSFKLFKEALALIPGEFSILVVWEGGDTVETIRVKDGKLTQKKS